MKKPSLAVILGGSPPKEAPEHDDHDEEMDDDLSPEKISERKKDAGEELIDAIKRGDVQKLVKAFEALHGLDHAEWESEGDEPDEDDHDDY